MNLIVDTCGPALLLALCDGPVVLDTSYVDMVTGQSEAIVPALAGLMARAGLPPAFAFGKIGVCVGPGSFTGLRVGLACARARAALMETPIAALNRLACIALTASVDSPVRVEIDARRGEHFVQRFTQSGAAQGPPMLVPSDQLADLKHQYPQDTVIAQMPAPDVLAAACARLTHEQPGAAHTAIAPLYVRAPDAKAQRAQLHARPL
ncbi:MAG: tRNA (adenosine(37)-N6)-threonylcarbamoyltransferase complex dimerization subunit type 1 TsaB [Pseudomonadota bacterium]